ncbi:MAG: Hsp20 family protein [Rhodospirillales bacterium]|nr:Hsp20 family protein [Rhodospirillales bacterium]
MRSYDFSPLFRYSVGFDRLERLLDHSRERAESAPGYPPYNIESVDENAYRITMAVAGFREDELDIIIKENELSISGRAGQSDGETQYLHRGIATRSFERRFDLADHVKVTGGNLDNGILTVDLVREVPEASKPRKVEITKAPAPALGGPVGKQLGDGDKKAA